MAMWSRPTWARGLKQEVVPRQGGRVVSRPTWARGLKLSLTLTLTLMLCRVPRGRVD